LPRVCPSGFGVQAAAPIMVGCRNHDAKIPNVDFRIGLSNRRLAYAVSK
jgi:hypothetical protein